ncbi:MAG: putative tricarboxylic transport rane protein, partial [Clostridia bacterium]|nr:putative tricarboxylic transport rane protein [Clostridia bacterium]
PGKLNIGGTDAAGYDEVLVNLWASKAGIQVKYVPFAAASEANAAILGGHIDVLHEEAGPMKALIDGKKVKPLVIFMEKRTDMFPDVPTAKELGWDITIGRWRGFAAKKGTPEDRIKILYEAFAKSMEAPVYKTMEKENLLNLRPGLMGPEEFQKFIDSELQVYGDVLKKLGHIK